MSGREYGLQGFATKCRQIEGSASMLFFVLSLAYLSLIYEVGLSERFALAGAMVIANIVAVLIVGRLRQAQTAPIRRYLETEVGVASRGGAASHVSSALSSLVSLPLKMQRAAFVSFGAAVSLVPVTMWSIGFDGWLSLERFRSLAIISFVASLLSGTALFYWATERFIGLRREISTVENDEAAEDGLVIRTPIRRKILLAVAIPTFASVLLMVDIVSERVRSSTEADAAQWALLAVESVALGERELSLEERISTQLPDRKFWSQPIEIVELDVDSIRLGGLTSTKMSGAFRASLDQALTSPRAAGLLRPVRGPEIGAYRKLDGGRVLVAKVERAKLGNQVAALEWALAFVCLSMLGVSVAIGRLAAADLSGGVSALQLAADRIASGDLTMNAGVESGDEVGATSIALAAAGKILRTTVAQMSSTADAADRTATEISGSLADLLNSNAEYAQQIQQTNQVVGAIAARVDETSEYALALSATIDESGESLLELGANGDELNETASVLTSKVTAVSDSLEQMVQSVRQVAGISERLTAASEETSSSMEEMASAMRAADTSAETTANLSREVVSKAELGQAKVVQTIAGMEAIRDATDAAEKVIRGLGARTHEIGGILDVIDDVADETNLLALNAAIIAAQAGEHGKAFSVVADEIKELADRVLASTKEIGGLIRAVQDESENAIGAIEAGSASVMSGVDLSAEAGRTLEEITVTSRESGLRIGEIVVSVREQTKAASHVVGLMEKVRESAEEIDSAGRQQDAGNEVVHQSALAMREVAQKVRHTTEEQTVSFGRIRDNVSGVREAIEKITRSLGEQVGDCRQAKETLGRVSKKSEADESVAKKMQDAVSDLNTQAAALREDAERFRI